MNYLIGFLWVTILLSYISEHYRKKKALLAFPLEYLGEITTLLFRNDETKAFLRVIQLTNWTPREAKKFIDRLQERIKPE